MSSLTTPERAVPTCTLLIHDSRDGTWAWASAGFADDPLLDLDPSEVWPGLAQASSVRIDLTGVPLASSRMIAWLLRVRDVSRGPVTLQVGARTATTLRMLGLSALFRVIVGGSPSRACLTETAAHVRG